MAQRALFEHYATNQLGELVRDSSLVSIFDESLNWLDLPPQSFRDYATCKERLPFDGVPPEPTIYRREPTFLIVQAHRIWLTLRKIDQYLSKAPDALLLNLGAFPFTIDLAIREYLQRKCAVIGTINQPLPIDWRKILHTKNMECIPVNLDPLVRASCELPGMTDTLPLEGNSVDFILFSHVIEHLYHPILILREAFRVLKNGGTLLLSTDNGLMLSGFLNYLNAARYLYEPVENTAAMAFHDWRGHVRFYTEGDLRGLLESSGFRVRECEFYEVLYNSLWDEYFFDPYLWMPKWRADLLTSLPAYRNEILLIAGK